MMFFLCEIDFSSGTYLVKVIDRPSDKSSLLKVRGPLNIAMMNTNLNHIYKSSWLFVLLLIFYSTDRFT